MRASDLAIAAAFATALAPVPIFGQASLMLQVPTAPTAVLGEGRVHLVYELWLSNLGPLDLTLRTLEVVSDEDEILLTYQDSVLWQAIGRNNGTSLTGEDRRKIRGGMWALVWLWVTLDDPTQMPRLIRHRLVTEHIDKSGELRTTVREGGTTMPLPGAPVVAPPLSGGDWRAGAVSNYSHHRRGGPLGTNGSVSERFAIDYIRQDAFGRMYSGDRFRNESYYAYGADVLAVADAVVLSAEDGAPDNVPYAPNGEILSRGLGNWVDLDLGDGHYATYLHLKPNTVRVRAGDLVERGQVIGQVGSSGNSNAPHLHFLIQDAPEPARPAVFEERPEGLPYVHETFQVVGTPATPFCSCNDGDCAPLPVTRREFEMPMEVLVRFSEQDRQEELGPPPQMGSERNGALCRLMEGQYLLDERRVSEAVVAFSEARRMDATITIPAWHWGTLCEIGSLWGVASEVMEACDRAVALEPNNGDWRRTRGLAWGMLGDRDGAAREIEHYVGWEPRDDLREQYEAYLDLLRRGENPFTRDTVDELRMQVPSVLDWWN
jgi:peptidase M23-like protein